MEDVATNLEMIRRNIAKACKKSNRNPDDITIIGVTKYSTIERTKEALEAGVMHLGENRTDELLHKYNQLGDVNASIHWHFIGTLQSRKVKDIVNEVVAIHSLDRESVAKQIEKRATKPVDCFVQVNVSGEETKHGLQPKEVLPFIKDMVAYEKVRIVGLMTMAPHVDDERVLRNTFQELAGLKEKVQREKWSHAPCEYLSMGMSNDYEIAIEEGATHIRIGSALVGSKKQEANT
ncbi:MAG TPA: YggS family pyridoxal phosphate-dependent enzyme [Bacillota bacterium]|nr:YggS family pyridoxal phosphate-dependent enzyme [Bacillota bacterium]